MKFEDKLKAHTTDYLKTLKIWIGKHLQEGVDPEHAVNKIRSMDRMFNEKLLGLRKIPDPDQPEESQD